MLGTKNRYNIITTDLPFTWHWRAITLNSLMVNAVSEFSIFLYLFF